MPKTPQGKIVCPDCGGSNIDPRSVVVGVQPYQRPDPPEGPRPTRVVERKYQCRDCEKDFSIIEEAFD
jgi:DNA-directed RNA polymerase subunit RPC12/RpoP